MKFNDLENSNKNLLKTEKEVIGYQEEIRSNLKPRAKPSLEFFQNDIDQAIDNVLSNKDNEWIVAIPKYKSEIKVILSKSIDLFLKEYLHNNEDPVLLTSVESIQNVAEYLFYNLENISEDIKKYNGNGNFSSHRVVAYHDYKEINKFLNDDIATAKELDMDLEKFQKIFTKNRRKDLVFERISDPKARALMIKNALDNLLTDENLAKELNMTIEEVGVFTPGKRVHFAFKNNDPVEALKRVKKHIEQTLTDENIAVELDLSIEEVKEIFTKGLKLHMAVRNISDPMEAMQKIKIHLETTLSDENLAKELNISKEEVANFFSFAIKINIAANSIESPLNTVLKIKNNLENILTKDNIIKTLKITEEEFRVIFTPNVIKSTGIHYPDKPMLRLKEIKESFESLNDENLAKELNIDMEEVQKLFPDYIKTQIITKSNLKSLFKKIKSFVENYNYLTDENIAKELNIKVEEAKEIFPDTLKKELALVSNPLKKFHNEFKINFFDILSFDNIANELDMTIEEVKEIFTISRRYNMAIDTNINCVEQLHRIKKNRFEIFTKENIAENLKIDIKFVDEVFSSEVLNHFAVNFPTRPMEGLNLFYEAWFKVLDSKNIAKELGVDSTLTEGLLAPGLRRMIALGYLNDPILAVCSFVLGDAEFGTYNNLRPTNSVLIDAAKKYKDKKMTEKKKFV